MLNDVDLDRLLDRARHGYRLPSEPDLDHLWRGIQARQAAQRHATTGAWWRRAAIAASLAGAFALGRLSREAAPEPTIAVAPDTVRTNLVVTDAASTLLGQTVVLLSALPAENARTTTAFARQAGELLLSTRLLLDAPESRRDPALVALLEDLELVLAQLARLHNGEPRGELELITDAMRQQDLVPRIRTIAAGLQAGAD